MVTSSMAYNVIKSQILQDTVQFQKNFLQYNEITKTLEKKLQNLSTIKNDVQKRFDRSSRRRLKVLYSIIALQMFFTQYGTYYLYSWDIMEPICCLFGIFDMTVAYAYWLMKTRDFDFENFEDDFKTKKSEKVYSNISLIDQKTDVEEMLDHINSYQALHGEELPHILESLDHKFAAKSEN